MVKGVPNKANAVAQSSAVRTSETRTRTVFAIDPSPRPFPKEYVFGSKSSLVHLGN
jgi:hypothetical protein